MPDAQRDLTGLLSGLMGGQALQSDSPPGSGGTGFSSTGDSNEVSDILGSLLGGGMTGTSAPQQSSGGSDLVGSLLGSLLGGGMTGTSSSQQTSGSGDLMGSLLGSLLGGGSSSGGDAMGGLLGSLIGSSQASNNVSQQTGIAPSLVQALLPMLIGLLFRGDRRSSARSGEVDIDGDGIPDNSDQLLALMQTVQQGGDVDISDVRSSGYARALANQSGYPVDEVAPATVKILEYLAQQQ
jgi:hypothetical protein